MLVVDCGFDAGVMFEDWLDNKHHFVARLVGVSDVSKNGTVYDFELEETFK